MRRWYAVQIIEETVINYFANLNTKGHHIRKWFKKIREEWDLNKLKSAPNDASQKKKLLWDEWRTKRHKFLYKKHIFYSHYTKKIANQKLCDTLSV